MIKITSHDIDALLIEYKIVESEVDAAIICNCADDSYNIPSKPFIALTMRNAFKTVKQSIGLEHWYKYFDCDDFSRLYALYAQILHAKTEGKTANALAVGEFWYSTKKSGHAINIIITSESPTSKLEIIFVEPQTGNIIQLTEEERSRAHFIRF